MVASDGGVKLGTISAEEMVHEAVWPMLAPLVKEAVDFYGQYEVADVVRNVASGVWQMWVAMSPEKVHSIGVTAIDNYPRMRVATVIMVAGSELSRWREFLEIIEEWAKVNDCDKFTFYGRKGWAKKFPDAKVDGMIFSRNLRNGAEVSRNAAGQSDHAAVGTSAALH